MLNINEKYIKLNVLLPGYPTGTRVPAAALSVTQTGSRRKT